MFKPTNIVSISRAKRANIPISQYRFNIASEASKYLLVSICMLLCISTAYGADKGNPPVAHWRFDEQGGPTVFDESANNNDGTLTPGAGGTNTAAGQMWTRQGKIGGALKCDGTDDYVQINGAKLNYPSAFTISFWTKPTSKTDSGFIAINTSFPSAGLRGFFEPDNTILLQGYAGGVWRSNSVSLNKYTYGIWNYITISFSSPVLTVYINGVLTDALNWGGDFTMNTGGINNIGSAQGTGYSFFGLIDDVRIYNYARTPAQILSDYNAGSAAHLGSGTDPNEGNPPAGYWNFDEASGQNAYDRSGSGNNGQLGATAGSEASDPTWTNAGKNGGALSFDGTDDYVETPGPDWANNDGLSWTIEGWFKATSLPSGKYAIVANEVGNHVDTYIAVETNGTNLEAVAWNGAWNAIQLAISPNVWYHFASIFKQGIGREFYVNGVLAGSNSQTVINGDTGNSLDTRSWRIGYSGHSAIGYFPGQIDGVKIYNYARTAGQIAYDYNKGKPVAYYTFDEGGGTIAHNESSTADSGTAPVAWWRMDEGTGGTTTDVSGRGNTGTLYPQAGGTNTTTANMWDQTGKIGPDCLEFDGTDDYVGVPFIDVMSSGTVSAWVKSNTMDQRQYLFHTGSNAYWYYGIQVLIDSGNKFYLQMTHHPTYGGGAYGNTTLSAGQWYYLTATWDTSQNVAYVYVNGVRDGSGTTVQVTTKQATTFGNRVELTEAFDGVIDDMRIYNYVRTAEQIYNDYKTTHGTLVGDTKFVDGKIGKALQFDGSGDYVDIGDQAILDMGTINFSVEAWVKTNDASSDTWYRRIYGKGYSGDGYSTYIYTDGKLQYISNSVASNSTSMAINDNAWHHVSTVRSGSSIKIYVDGILGLDQTNAAWAADLTNTEPFRIGVLSDGGTTQGHWNGLIDDVRIYNYARTANDILKDYNAGAPVRLGAQSAGEIDPWAGALPVAHWKMDENTGVLANDASENENTGTLGGDGAGTDVPTWAQGKLGPCLSFDGGDYVNVMTSGITSDNGTIELWVKKNNSWNVDNEEQLVNIIPYLTYGADTGFYLSNHNGVGLHFRMGNTGGAYINYQASDNFVIGQWYFITVTWDSDNQEKMYVNGIVVDSDSFAHNPGGAIPANASIGSRLTTYSGSYQYFNGLIDDVKIYNYARTQAQIAWDYNHGKPVAHWRFDEASDGSSADGDTAYDESTNNNDAAGNNGANNTGLTWTTGKIGGAISFDGVDDYVDCGNASSLNITNSITVEAWAYPKAYDAAGKMIVAKYTPGGSGYGVYLDITDGHIVVRYDGLGDHYFDTGIVPTLNQWSHIVYTFNGSMIYVYLNGKQVNSKSLSGSLIVDANTLKIGRYTSSGVHFFNGYIDDVRIYNYARTAEQILQDYNNGAAARLGD